MTERADGRTWRDVQRAAPPSDAGSPSRRHSRASSHSRRNCSSGSAAAGAMPHRSKPHASAWRFTRRRRSARDRQRGRHEADAPGVRPSHSWRSTYGRMPPWRNATSSSGVSIRAIATISRLVPSARRDPRPCTSPPGLRLVAHAERRRSVSRPVSFSDAAFSPSRKLQRQHAHVDEIAAMDALEALREHRLDAEQQRALRRPVARRARAVFLAGDDHQRHAAPRGTSPTRRRSSSPRPSGSSVVQPPSVPGASWLRRRMLANVPRIITS